MKFPIFVKDSRNLSLWQKLRSSCKLPSMLLKGGKIQIITLTSKKWRPAFLQLSFFLFNLALVEGILEVLRRKCHFVWLKWPSREILTPFPLKTCKYSFYLLINLWEITELPNTGSTTYLVLKGLDPGSSIQSSSKRFVVELPLHSSTIFAIY